MSEGADSFSAAEAQAIWYVRQRVGGVVLNNHAVRVLKVSQCAIQAVAALVLALVVR